MAQGNVIERFFIALGLDTKDVEKGINKTVDTVKGGLKELLVGAVLPAVGALASGALVQQFTEEITQVDRLSKSLGINIEQLQAWQGVAENAGVAGEEIGEIFADLNDWMIDSAVNGSGALNDFIEKGMLPAVKDANGAMKSTEQYALELADAFAKMDKQQATGIGRQIGISNAGMVAFFQQGSASISAQMQQIKQLGVYTEDDAKAAKEFSVAIKDLSRALKMLLLPLFRIVAPAATFIARGIQEATKHTAAFIPVLVGLAAVLSAALYPALIKNAKAALAFLASPWGILLAALTAIGLLLDDFVTWLEGGESAFGDFYESIFGDAENVKKTIDEFVTNAKAAFDDFKDIVAGMVDDIAAAFEIVRQIFNGFVNNAMEMADRIQAAIDNMQNGFNDFKTSASQSILKFVDNAKAVFNDFKNFVGAVWESISPPVIAFGELLLALGKTAWDWAHVVYNAVMLVLEVFRGLITGGEDMSNRISAALDNLRNSFNTVLEDIKAYVEKWWNFISPIFNKVSSLFSMGDSISGFLGMTGDAALATPATAGAGTTNNQSNVDNSQYQITQNMTFNGVKDGEQAAGLVKDNPWSGLTAQGNTSQSGSI